MISSQKPVFPPNSPYRALAARLDTLPQRFPPAADESELRLLAKIFTEDEAALAAVLLPELETPAKIAERLGLDLRALTGLLKAMAVKGLVAMGKTPDGRLGFGLMPFVVGFYENQLHRMDAEMARLFEDYFQQGFSTVLSARPHLHRVVPVGVSIKNTIEVQPFESVSGLVDQAQSWGVQDCICRVQKALVGDPCEHPRDVCMILSYTPGAFASSTTIRALTHEAAVQTLQRAANAGLVHCVSNNQRDLWYICNCCTCSCGVLRGMAELGIANVVARSAFVNRVDAALCTGCGTCLSACQFSAIEVNGQASILETRCVGCGVCVLACPEGALGLERRGGEDQPPVSEEAWRAARQARQ